MTLVVLWLGISAGKLVVSEHAKKAVALRAFLIKCGLHELKVKFITVINELITGYEENTQMTHLD